MQFIPHGPDIPDALLQAHEEGRVVFFCGAGVSYPAGLPGFKGLVETIYRLSGTVPSDIERKAIELGQFDATLDLLERRLPGQRLAIRRALAEALKPKLRRKGATDTQAALLQLARSREGALRLVTTNFDRVFHKAAKGIGQVFREYAAPMLPIPKNSRWDGLVYLHGVLPERVEATALNRLVVTSGDFGLAYLTERWAARFVSELFRNYVVCFVGYSINDPVLRYMMDALAADRRLGEATLEAWALGDCEPGLEHRQKIEWEAKGVTPILYRVPSGSNDHSAIHKTLHVWAETYRDGVLGKERIVISHALARPSESTQQDDFVGRMLWALTDKSGLPAKRFAEFNPAPSLDWLLKAFTEERFIHSDLARFSVPPHVEVNENLRFSLIRRPAPYNLAPQMLLASGGIASSQWDNVMFQIARWLTRHLNNPDLLIWIAQNGGKLHASWAWQIKHELDNLANLERLGKTEELDKIRTEASQGIPSRSMRTLWRMLLSDRVKSSWRNSELYSWKNRFQAEGLSATLRLELRDLLAPQIFVKQPLRWGEEELSNESGHMRKLVDWELVLASDYVHSALQDIPSEQWKSALPDLVDDFQQVLRDALDLLRELGEADDYNDRSHWDLPSIAPHRQNRSFRDWVCLVELLRDAWLAVFSRDNIHATHIAQSWFKLSFPTFKRLALFAASQDDCILPEKWVDWLLLDRAYWLWSTGTKREMFRLIVLQGRHLTGSTQQRLEAAILAGPPREMYKDSLSEEVWQELVSHSIWLRLAKLESSGLALGAPSAERLSTLSASYPDWQLAGNERDEFSHWMSGSRDPDYADQVKVDLAPRKRADLVNWLLKEPSKKNFLHEDTWQDVCRKHLLNSIYALGDLAHQGLWPHTRWCEALQAWSEDRLIVRSWRYAAPIIQTMPDDTLKEIIQSITWWIKTVSKSTNEHEDILLDICRRVLALPLKASTGITRDEEPLDQPITEAINHPIGHITEALIDLWFKQNPSDGDQLPATIKPLFTALCDLNTDRFRHGRVLLGSRLIALFRVDRAWTEQFLLPLFNWENPGEAKGVWRGFLWSPRLYQPLLIAFKTHFLDSANHYTDLGEHRHQFSAFLTYVALESIESFTLEDFRTAISALPQEGLERCAQALYQSLEGSGDQREDYWQNRVQPFWQSVWPKSRDLATKQISESLVRMSIAARSEFPAAFSMVRDWIQPLEHPHYIVQLLNESGLHERFPQDTLHLLGTVITELQWPLQELSSCLDKIVKIAPQLMRDAQYLRLREYCRRQGI